MGYPGDEGGGPPESRLDARTRRAALSSQSRAAQPWAIPPQEPAAPGEEEPGEAVGRRRAPAPGSAGTTGDSPAHLGYGGRSGYGGETSIPGESSGSHRRPGGPSSHPGWTADPAAAGYAAPSPGGTGYPPAAQETGRPPATPGTGYPPAAQETGRPPATPGTGYPPATRGTGSGRGTGRRRREPAEGSQPGRGATQPAPPSAMPNGGPPSRENAWRRPERRPGQEIQGAPGNGSAGGGSQPRGSLWSAGAFRTAGPSGRGPVRGFPPAPGAPDPVYPPGQFSPWNAPALRAVSAAGRPALAAGSGPETSEPEYSLLAVSDPSADATATQTWAVLDDAQLAGEWTTARAGAPARSGLDESGRPAGGEGPQTGPRGFFEPTDGPETPPGPPAPDSPDRDLPHRDLPHRDSPRRGSRPGPEPPHRRTTRARRGTGCPGAPGTRAGLVSPGRRLPGETGFPGEPGFPAGTESPGDTGLAGESSYPGRTDPSLRTARPGGRLAARQQEKKSRPGQPSQGGPGRNRACRRASPKPRPQTRAGPRREGRGRRPGAASPANHASRPAGPGCGSCRWS